MPSKEVLGKRYQRWKKRALKAEAELARVKEQATHKINGLQDQLERAQQRAHAGDEARHELGERAARERGEQGIYG